LFDYEFFDLETQITSQQSVKLSLGESYPGSQAKARSLANLQIVRDYDILFNRTLHT